MIRWFFWRLNSHLFEFSDPESGISGLGRQDGDEVSFVALLSKDPGKWRLRAFLERCEERFSKVTVVEIMNERLWSFLESLGYRRCMHVGRDGKISHGMCWKKPEPQEAQ